MIQVFIQAEAQSKQRLQVDETTLAIKKTLILPIRHPYAYGFILNSHAMDGDGLDCFVITSTALHAGEIIACEPVAVLEMWENHEADSKVLAVPLGEDTALPHSVQSTLSLFLFNLFTHFPDSGLRIGDLLPASAAREFIQQARLNSNAP
jgi:inorganic pyrophosphatase